MTTRRSWALATVVVPLVLLNGGCERSSSPPTESHASPGTRPPESNEKSDPKRTGHLDVHVDENGGVNVDIERRKPTTPPDAP
jgi:hypothetical protein